MPPSQPPSSRPLHPAQSLLARAHSPSTAAAIFQDRARTKPLHLAPTSKRISKGDQKQRPDPKSQPRKKSAPSTAGATAAATATTTKTIPNATTAARAARAARASERRKQSGPEKGPGAVVAAAAITDDVIVEDARQGRRLHRLRNKEYARRKQCPKPLSAKEKKSLGLRGVAALKNRKEPNQTQGEGQGKRAGATTKVEYSIYAGLHDLWAGYVREVLGLNLTKKPRLSVAQHGPLLASLDYHGAQVTVVRCACVGRVGVSGIVVRDTLATFAIVEKAGKGRGTGRVVIVPKVGTVFRVDVPMEEEEEAGKGGDGNGEDGIEGEKEGNEAGMGGERELAEKVLMSFELHGDQFQVRPADRANRKFKWKRMEYV